MNAYLAIFISVIIGATIDARMWGDKKLDHPLLKRYTDLYWLGGWNLIMPIIWMSTSISLPMFLLISFGMSVFWDAVYFKWTDNVWIRPIRVWSALPWYGPNRTFNRCLSVEDKMLIIGFNSNEDMTKFNWLRIAVLVGSTLI